MQSDTMAATAEAESKPGEATPRAVAEQEASEALSANDDGSTSAVGSPPSASSPTSKEAGKETVGKALSEAPTGEAKDTASQSAAIGRVLSAPATRRSKSSSSKGSRRQSSKGTAVKSARSSVGKKPSGALGGEDGAMTPADKAQEATPQTTADGPPIGKRISAALVSAIAEEEDWSAEPRPSQLVAALPPHEGRKSVVSAKSASSASSVSSSPSSVTSKSSSASSRKSVASSVSSGSSASSFMANAGNNALGRATMLKPKPAAKAPAEQATASPKTGEHIEREEAEKKAAEQRRLLKIEEQKKEFSRWAQRANAGLQMQAQANVGNKSGEKRRNVEEEYKAEMAALANNETAKKMQDLAKQRIAKKIMERQEQRMNQERFNKAILRIQNGYRANVGKRERERHLETRRRLVGACLFFQTRYRGHTAKIEAMIKLEELRQKYSLWTQTRYRGITTRKIYKKYADELRRAIVWLQTRYRGCSIHKRANGMLQNLFNSRLEKFDAIATGHVKKGLYTIAKKKQYEEALRSFYMKSLERHRVCTEQRAPRASAKSYEEDAELQEVYVYMQRRARDRKTKQQEEAEKTKASELPPEAPPELQPDLPPEPPPEIPTQAEEALDSG
eukprot:TRINITY_DN57075_c0_g1_i1.p1 TRINITY_DN57075_c0_g1~~TRINITY_DN57075_c0_g1_i1.p1  ORF type:complete len:620 (-),score=150.63 TRINITY_DN57075_c0_g1_i1:893-2752(-)